LQRFVGAMPEEFRDRGRADKKAKKDKKRKRKDSRDNKDRPADAENRKASRPEPVPEAPAPEPVPESPSEELDENMEGVVEEETEEDVEKRLAESRARREALVAKWVTRGEEAGVPGVVALPETSTSLPDDEPAEDDGGDEVAEFFAQQKNKSEGDTAEVTAEAVEKKKAVNRFILQQRAEHDGDMFGEGTDEALNNAKTLSAGQTGASGDDWNDHEGYYKAQIGEVLEGRYRVTENDCGKGVFSNVIKCEDQKHKRMVAIKVTRANDMMKEAADKEVEVLQRLNNADKEGKRHVIRLLNTFEYRGHYCLVFECMWDNLRVALKKYTKDKGMSLKAVRAYTKQLLIALAHIHRCQYVHADIKPDNILISAGHNDVKICDLGSAVDFTEVEATPYLVSRFYRAPEITIAAKYGPAADVFALGCSFFELFTGKILFNGKSNNDMLRLFMEYKGKLPHKMIKSGTAWKKHFDDNLDFKFLDYDKLTRKKKLRTITDCSAKKSIQEVILARVGLDKQKSSDSEDQLYVKKAKQFADLVEKMTTLNPETRPSASDLITHHFVGEWHSKGGPKKA